MDLEVEAAELEKRIGSRASWAVDGLVGLALATGFGQKACAGGNVVEIIAIHAFLSDTDASLET